MWIIKLSSLFHATDTYLEFISNSLKTARDGVNVSYAILNKTTKKLCPIVAF
jgi:protein gp37